MQTCSMGNIVSPVAYCTWVWAVPIFQPPFPSVYPHYLFIWTLNIPFIGLRTGIDSRIPWSPNSSWVRPSGVTTWCYPPLCRSSVLPLNNFCWLSLNSFHISAIELVRAEFIISSRHINLHFSSLNLILLPERISEPFRSFFIISPCLLTTATPVSLENDCTIRKQCRQCHSALGKLHAILGFQLLEFHPWQRGSTRSRQSWASA